MQRDRDDVHGIAQVAAVVAAARRSLPSTSYPRLLARLHDIVWMGYQGAQEAYTDRRHERAQVAAFVIALLLIHAALITASSAFRIAAAATDAAQF